MSDILELNNKILEISQLNINLEEQNKKLKEDMKQITFKFQKQIQDLSSNSSILEAKSTALEFEVHKKEKELKQKDEIISNHSVEKEKLNEIQLILLDKENEIEALKSKVNKEDEDHQFAVNQAHLNEIEKNKLAFQLKDAQEQIENLQKEKSDLESKLDKANKELEEKKNVEEELKNLKDEYNKKKEDFTISEKSLAYARSQVEQLEKDKNELKAILDKTNKDLQNQIEKAQVQSVGSNEFFANERVTDLFSESLNIINQKNGSISFQELVEQTILNFDFFLEGAFHSSYHGNIVAPLTVYHDNIKDIFNTLFSRGFFNKLKYVKGEYEAIMNVDASDIGSELIEKVAKEIYESNIIYRSLDMSKEKIDAYINQLKSLNIPEENIKLIIESFKKKIERNKTITINSITNLLEKCANLIHNGNLEFKKENIFDFKTMYNFKAYNISKGNLYVDLSQLTNKTVEGVFNLIKYPPEKIIKVQLVNNLNYQKISDIRVFKMFLCLATYYPNILSFSLKDCQNLSMDIINYLVFIIADFRAVKILNFENDKINDEQMKPLCEGIKQNKSIIALFLNKNEIGSNGAMYLADSLAQNKSIERIYLSNNNIREDGLESLLDTLVANKKKITCLDLSNNNLKKDDFKKISNFLKEDPDLNTICLNGNIIDNQGCIFMGIGFPRAKKMKIINMANMGISGENSMKLFQQFYAEEIILDNNPIKDNGMLTLGKSLIGNNSIQKISLKNTKFTANGLNHFLNLARDCKSLKQIHFENNEINDKISELLFGFVNGKKSEVKFYITKDMITDIMRKEFYQKNEGFVLV